MPDGGHRRGDRGSTRPAPQEVEPIKVAALLHDIGRVAVPGPVLEKPAPLTTEECQGVVQHPRVGQVIIDQVAAVKDAGAIILHHHEQFAGHGYPHGLRGADIPLGARIVAIADAHDAMVHGRPYCRAAISHAAAAACAPRSGGGGWPASGRRRPDRTDRLAAGFARRSRC